MKTFERSRLAAALFLIAGLLLLLAISALTVLYTVPGAAGYTVYGTNSGTAVEEDELLLVMNDTAPTAIEPDMLIVCRQGEDEVCAVRVTENNTLEGRLFIAGADTQSVTYDAVIGRVCYHIPRIGAGLRYFEMTGGKIYAGLIALCGVLCIILSARTRARRRQWLVEREIAGRLHAADEN